MAKWIYRRKGGPRLNYRALGFVAHPGDILEADVAPDSRWVLHDDQSASPTVTYPEAVGEITTPITGGYSGTLQDIFDAADVAAAAAATAAATATTAQTTADGKGKVWYSTSSPGTTANTAGDIWFRKDGGTQTVTEQWEGLGGTSWQQVTLSSAVIANLDAGKLTAGSAFINGLYVKTALTLGDASNNGSIQSYDFAGQPVGIYMDKYGIVAKGGTIAGTAITGGTITGTTLMGGTTFTGGIDADTIDCGGLIQTTVGGISSAAYVYAATDMVAGGGVTGTEVYTNTSGTTGSAANCRIGSGGRLVVSTSSRRYKYDIEDAELDLDALLSVQPRTFRRYDDDNYDADNPAIARVHVGLIAEEVDDLGLDSMVDRDAEGLANGINWDVLGVHLLAVVQQQAAQIAALTARLDALETTR